MTQIIRFFAPIDPPKKTSQQKGLAVRKGGKRKGAPYAYTKPEVAAEYADFARIAELHKPDAPLEGPLFLRIHVTYPFPDGDSRAKHYDRLWFTGKPDMDNVCKGLQDVLEALGFFSDDKQIVWGDPRKMIGKEFGVEVELQTLTQLGE